MRAVLQRVAQASVIIAGTVKADIGPGLVVLLGVEESDSNDDVEWLSGKIARMRLFQDEGGLMNKSVQEVSGQIIVVSQFTLYASTRKGNRPSWSRAAAPPHATVLYNAFVAALSRESGRPVQTGEFGADMKVALVNDGPVTVIIDSRLRE